MQRCSWAPYEQRVKKWRLRNHWTTKTRHKQYVFPLNLQIHSSKGLLICYIKLFYGLLLQTGMWMSFLQGKAMQPLGVVLLACLLQAYLYKLQMSICLFLWSLHSLQFRMPVLKLPGRKEIFQWTQLMLINPAVGLTKGTHIISLCVLLKCRIAKLDSSDL